jgi:hypothetical protein
MYSTAVPSIRRVQVIWTYLALILLDAPQAGSVEQPNHKLRFGVRFYLQRALLVSYSPYGQ